jgi:hypothetical protein
LVVAISTCIPLILYYDYNKLSVGFGGKFYKGLCKKWIAMYRRFEKGFSVYKNADNPVWVAPHSGSAFETPTSRDWNSDTVASLCWLKSGGSLVLSTVTRKRIWGIDYNRDPPQAAHAIRMYPEFVADRNRPRLQDYRSRYAFVARNKADYDERLRMYTDFWTTVGNLGSIIIMCHRKFARLKNYPSLIDIVTYEGRGVDTHIITGVIDQINKKYGRQLKRIGKHYRMFLLTETKRITERIRRVYGEFDLEKTDIEYHLWLKEDIANIKRLAGDLSCQALETELCIKNFLGAVKQALKLQITPSVTLENFFKGKKALSVKSKFFERHFLVMEAEVNAFFGYWYPDLAAEIILDIVSMLRGAKLYKKLGIRQTNMADFL